MYHTPARAGNQTTLLDLPQELLVAILRHVSGRKSTDTTVIGTDALQCMLPSAESCRSLNAAVYQSMDAVVMSGNNVLDSSVLALCERVGLDLRHLVLRSCDMLTNASVLHIAAHARMLAKVDLSFVESVTDYGVIRLCRATRSTLRQILLRKCTQLTDVSAAAIGSCARVADVDLSFVSTLTDVGVTQLVSGIGSTLRTLALAECPHLSDLSLEAIGQYCSTLSRFCARGLPLISDAGFGALCRGIGPAVRGIDILDCPSLTRDAVLGALHKQCPRISAVLPSDADRRPLRQIIITTLLQNIFIVRGRDPTSRRNTVHMIAADNGQFGGTSTLNSGKIDLSLLGVVICKTYGNSFDDNAKTMLHRDYGIPKSAL